MDLIKDYTLIYILANLDLYESIEQNKLKKIFKTLIKTLKSHNSIEEEVANFFLNNANAIANLILDILDRTPDESIIYVVGKIIKFLIEDKNSLSRILNFDFFKRIYNLTKSEKFVYSTEAFKILCV